MQRAAVVCHGRRAAGIGCCKGISRLAVQFALVLTGVRDRPLGVGRMQCQHGNRGGQDDLHRTTRANTGGRTVPIGRDRVVTTRRARQVEQPKEEGDYGPAGAEGGGESHALHGGTTIPPQRSVFHKHPTYVERKKATGLTADIDAVSPSISSVRRGPGWCACHVYGVSGQWSEIRLLEPISKQALTHDLVSETSASCQCLAPPRDRTRCLDLELAPPKRAVRCRGSCQAVRPSDPKALYEGPRSLALSIQRLVHSMTYISIA